MDCLLISACLLGRNCKYSGGNNALKEKDILRLREKYRLIAVCPESAGGLPTPREPSERRGIKVISRSGRDVTAQYQKGAEIAVYLARKYGCAAALLKERSPSCGSGYIYDGSFSGTLVSGEGMAAQMLKEYGVPVFGETEINKLF